MADIPVLVDPDSEPAAGPAPAARRSGTLSAISAASPASRIKLLDAEKLRKSVGSLARQVTGLFDDLEHDDRYRLETVQVSLEISAEGGVSLIGTAKAGARGGITLTFAPRARD